MKNLISLLLAIFWVLSLVCCSIPPSTTPPEDTDGPEQPDDTPTKPFLTNEFFVTEQSGLQLALTTGQDPYWNTHVDVSDSAIYGTGALSFVPTLLKLEQDNVIPAESILKAPLYAASGKISMYANTICGPYNTVVNKFVASQDLGVRAIGLSAGVTDREKDYKNAAKTADELAIKAKNAAVVSMNTHGSILASLVFKKAMDSDALYTQLDIDTIKAMVDSLLTTNGALYYIEQAYMHCVLGYVASAVVQAGVDAKKEETDSLWSRVHTMVNTEGTSLTDIKTTLTTAGLTLPSDLDESISKFIATKANALSAQTKLNAIETKESYTWDDISDAVLDLANIDAIEVNGFTAADVMANMDTIIQTMMSNGLSVTSQTGGGVYADIADHCGNYKTNVTINDLPYNGLVLSNIRATMLVTTSVSPTYLASCKAIFDQVEPPIGSAALKEVRAYVIDLSFRAETPDTKVYLKTGPITTTQDGKVESSTMFFSSKTGNTHTLQALIGCVRIVFFDTDSLSILGEAKLDAQNTLTTEEGVIAPLALDAKEGGTHMFELSSNTVAKISVLVYVDSDAVSNAKISHNVVSSVQSAIRLAFSDTEQQ